MDDRFAYFSDIEFVRGSSYVALAEPISTHNSVQSADHHIVPYIELSVLVKKRFFDILLDDISFLSSIGMFLLLLYDVVKFINFIDYSDSLSSIRKFSWLDDPYVLGAIFVCCFFFG